jgi:hypothetical protein
MEILANSRKMKKIRANARKMKKILADLSKNMLKLDMLKMYFRIIIFSTHILSSCISTAALYKRSENLSATRRFLGCQVATL